MQFAKPVKLMNFNWKDNLSRGLGQRLYYSLPPLSSATLLFRTIQPPTWEKQSNSPHNPPHTATTKSLSASAAFWIPTDGVDPPRNHTPLTSNSVWAEKKKKTLKPSDDYFLGPIAITTTNLQIPRCMILPNAEHQPSLWTY